jgi:four helix bundle protein
MSEDNHIPIEETEVFQIFRSLSNIIWRLVKEWSPFDRDTVGKQFVRAADRVGATLVEGDGRFGAAEAIQFFRISRGSARETKYWLTVSSDR